MAVPYHDTFSRIKIRKVQGDRSFHGDHFEYGLGCANERECPKNAFKVLHFTWATRSPKTQKRGSDGGRLRMPQALMGQGRLGESEGERCLCINIFDLRKRVMVGNCKIYFELSSKCSLIAQLVWVHEGTCNCVLRTV